MKKNDFIYTVIFGICFIVCIVLIGKMMLHKPVELFVPPIVNQTELNGNTNESTDNNQEGNENMITITDKEMSQIIMDNVNLPVNNLSLTINADSTATLEAQVDKENLKKYLIDNAFEMSNAINSAFVILPNTFPINADINIAIDKDGGLISLSPQKILINNIEIPVSLLTTAFIEPINMTINKLLCEGDFKFTTIKIVEGGLQLLE